MISIDNMPTEYSKVFEFKLKSFSLWMGVLFQLTSFLFLFLVLFFFLSRTEVYNSSLFRWLDCVIHKFWIPIFIIHHFLCEHHYSLYRLHHWMKGKYKMNAKCTDDLSTIWRLVLSKTLLSKETERNWSIKKSIAMTVRRGTWGFALLPRCRLFVLCGDEVNNIPSWGGAVFLILNLRYSVKRNNLQTTLRCCGLSYDRRC